MALLVKIATNFNLILNMIVIPFVQSTCYDFSTKQFFLFQFNFVGKLLGPKGNSMKRLQEETMTKMAVLGRGSMRDKQKVGKIGRYYLKNIYNFSK